MIQQVITLNNYNQQMDEGNEADYQSQLQKEQHQRQEIISIRKRLIAPNDILPCTIIRSEMSHHMLSIKHDIVIGESGYQMPLDSVQTYSEVQQGEKKQDRGVRAFVIKQNKNKSKSKSKSQISYIRNPEIGTSLANNSSDVTINTNILHFLSSNIKNMLKYPNNIVFMSPSLFLGQLDTLLFNFSKKSIPTQQKINQKKLFLIKILQNNKYFPSISYNYTLDKQIQKYDKLDLVLDEINKESNDLIFNDKFQSSNILLSFKYTEELNNKVALSGVEQQQYQVKLKRLQEKIYIVMTRFDYNTRSYGQWFYFQVKRHNNKHQSLKYKNNNNLYKFMIVNMTKNKTMFGKGLKISVCRNGIWKKQGLNIKYYKNSLRRQQSIDNLTQDFVQDQYLNNYINPTQYFYTLEFSLEISQGQDVYVAYNQPYTYSRLGKLLDKIVVKYESNKNNVINLRRQRILDKTYLSNNIDVITFSAKKNQIQIIPSQQKKVIIIMARTHPIQTAGSHVVEGILNQIYKTFIQNPQKSQPDNIYYKLLKYYIIKIIPMVNPDGVIIGNSRCNMNGYDLNRCWRVTKEDRCRQIYHIKNHVLEYQERIEMFIDLHAHSKKKNVFAYGCHDSSNPFATREFPYLLSKVSEKDFLFQECRFTKINNDRSTRNKKLNKDGTARIFLYDTLKIPNVFTIQNSYCSAKGSIFHYDEQSYQIIGADIFKAIALYFLPYYKQQKEQIQPNNSNDQRYKNQIKLKFNSDYISSLSLSISINEKEHQQQVEDRLDNLNEQLIQFRQNIIKQLHKNKQNVDVGLIKYCSISDSQQEKRINQSPQMKKRQKTVSEISIKKKPKKSNLSSIINDDSREIQRIPPSRKQKNTGRQGLNTSSTHSEAVLAKVKKVAQDNRFKIIGKQEEVDYKNIQIKRLLFNPQRQHNTFLVSTPKKPKSKLTQTIRNPHLSVIEIGTALNLQRIRQQKQTKPQINQPTNTKIQKLNRETLTSKQDEPIKQYFRAIIKKKHKFYPIKDKHTDIYLKQKTYRQKKVYEIKQSQIIFKGGNEAQGQTNRQLKTSQIQQKQRSWQKERDAKKSYYNNNNNNNNNNEALNNMSKIKMIHNKSLMKFNDYSLKYQHPSKATGSPNILINDLRLSKLVNLKNNIYKDKK